MARMTWGGIAAFNPRLIAGNPARCRGRGSVDRQTDLPAGAAMTSVLVAVPAGRGVGGWISRLAGEGVGGYGDVQNDGLEQLGFHECKRVQIESGSGWGCVSTQHDL